VGVGVAEARLTASIVVGIVVVVAIDYWVWIGTLFGERCLYQDQR
jgi:hypothetical protein